MMVVTLTHTLYMKQNARQGKLEKATKYLQPRVGITIKAKITSKLAPIAQKDFNMRNG